MDTEKNDHERARAPRLLVGVILLGVGGILIAKEFGVYFPNWLFSWQMALIAVGFIVGVKHRFNGIGWMIPMFIGGFFLLDNFFPDMSLKKFIAPFAVIAVGLVFIFKGKRKKCNYVGHWKRSNPLYTGTADAKDGDTLSENVVFGSIRKNVISKNFLGGEVAAVFGSSEVNLTQAEITTVARMEVSAVFGSVRLIVPPHWQIQLENNSVLGGVEDKRPETLVPSDKILMLEANAVFGGIEIKSY